MSRQLHCKCTVPKFKTNIPRNETALSHSQTHIHVSVIDLYIPTVSPQTQCSKIGAPIMGIYKSLKDTWMEKLGSRPRSFIDGNICFEFSVQCAGAQTLGQQLRAQLRHMVHARPLAWTLFYTIWCIFSLSVGTWNNIFALENYEETWPLLSPSSDKAFWDRLSQPELEYEPPRWKAGILPKR